MFNGLALKRHGVLHGLERLVPFSVGQLFESPSARHNGIDDPAPHGARHCLELPETYGANSFGLFKLMNRLWRQL